MATDDVEFLQGGVATANAVVRIGEHVVRPTNQHTPTIHLMGYMRDRGFDGVQRVVGIEPDGRERLTFVAGDVPLQPFPSQTRTTNRRVVDGRRRALQRVASVSLWMSLW